MKRATVRALQGLLLAIGAPLGWLLVRSLQGAHALHELAASPGIYAYMLFGTMAAFAIFGYLIGRREDDLLLLNRKLDAVAVTDWLTGLRNARYFHARLEEEFANSQRTGEPLAIAIFDLDFFKRINDRFGHLVGDEVLAATARAISAVTRRGETEARVGGEEFAIILPGSDSQDAHDAAERVREAIAAVAVPLPDASGTVRVTASAGVASTTDLPVDSARELYRAADNALLQAKAQGRDRTVVAGRIT